MYMELKQAIIKTQECYQDLADARWSTAPIFQAGNAVYVLAKFIKTTRLSKKLSEQYLGPFSMTERVGSHSYLMKLLEYLRAIHPIFHISQLEPALFSNISNCSNSSSCPSNWMGIQNLKQHRSLTQSGIDREQTPCCTTFTGPDMKVLQKNTSGLAVLT